jgi:hypothetical protein
MGKAERHPLAASEDPIFCAVGLPWPREIYILMVERERVGRKLLAAGRMGDHALWMTGQFALEHAARRGDRTPPEVHTVRMLRFMDEILRKVA